jgi:hypothetical protein
MRTQSSRSEHDEYARQRRFEGLLMEGTLDNICELNQQNEHNNTPGLGLSGGASV